ncbi:MAG: flippase activity-associated protein Agl23 [Anaerolineae bacterium]
MVTNIQSEPNNNSLNRLFSRSYAINWEVILIAIILVTAIFTRFYDLGSRAMSHDESLHTRFSYNLSEDGNFQHSPLMHGPILFHATALSYTLFGDNDFTSRIYTSILGVLLVMSPLLFRRWLGRWGAILACLMLLISPVTLYYGRYIRHDMPSILSALVMIWGIMMYLSGPDEQRRRAHWLYIIAVGMIWNLGSKETAFIYIAIIGIFLFLYWVVRLVQYFSQARVKGKPLFYIGMMGVFIGGVMSLGMYIILDIIKFDLVRSTPETSFGALPPDQQLTLWLWIVTIVGMMLFVVIGTMLWSFRDKPKQVPWGEMFAIIGVALVVCLTFVVVEEISHVEAPPSSETVEPADPDAVSTETESTISLNWAPMILVWSVAIAGFVFLFVTRRKDDPTYEGDEKDKLGQGFWGTMDLFPEFDLIIVIGTLILPWSTAFVPYLMQGTPADYSLLANSVPFGFSDALIRYIPSISTPAQAGQIVLGLMAFLPLISLSWALGLMWNWRRWLITSAVFHVLFAFFFTTIFTNMVGLATGMVYSLGYWLEQQGVRRGGQPQYYYLLIIMPFYEFLPVIGSVFAMFGGLNVFWRWRKRDNGARIELKRRALLAEAEDADDATLVDDPSDLIDTEHALSSAALARLVSRRAGQTIASNPVFWGLLILTVLAGLIFILSGFRLLYAPALLFIIPTILYVLYLHRQARSDVEQMVLAGLSPDEIAPRAADEIDSDTPLIRLQSIREQALLTQLPFLIFFSWLAVLNLVGYSLAGEKMPWLATHLTMPLVFLSAWYLGRIIEKIEWRKFTERGWLVTLVMILAFVALFQAIRPLVIGTRPFSGLSATQLNITYNWLAAVIVSGGAISAIFYLAQPIGLRHVRQLVMVVFFGILSVLTLRSALMASFVNYDYATEYLVYAHSAPGVKWVLDDIEEISLATTGGYDARIVYDNEVSWPYSWYFRNYNNVQYVGDNPTRRDVDDAVIVLVGAANRGKVEPLVEDRFVRFDHIRLWWPMQDYFNLTTARLDNLLDPINPTSAQLRQGIFDIWWNRDYTRYGQATGGDFSITNWPVSDRMHLYVRRDVAAQIWPYGVGEGTVLNPLESGEVNQCSANWQPLQANYALEAPESLINPVGIDIGADGRIYVAEQGRFDINSVGGHRIAVFDADGTFIEYLGERGNLPPDDDTQYFERPHSVEVQEDGSLFVVDTWNYRIQYFDDQINPITVWGQPGEYGAAAETQPVDGFWGPRDIEVDQSGRIFIADTGNKRVRVYEIVDGERVHLQDIGTAGSGLGQLDEPAGLAVHPNGNLYIADTWNRRISVFTTDGFFLDTFDVRGWYEEQGNRPYLAVDPDRELLYVTDPDAGRVLVYTTGGECVGSFGEPAGSSPTLGTFGVVAGIAVDDSGQVYVVDNRQGRVLVFTPFPQSATQSDPIAQPESTQEIFGEVIVPETTAEVDEIGG